MQSTGLILTLCVKGENNRVWLGLRNQKVLLTLVGMQGSGRVHRAQWKAYFPLEQINPKVKTMTNGSVQVEFQGDAATKISVRRVRRHTCRIYFESDKGIEISEHKQVMQESQSALD